jgi:hypothetical protein
MQNHLPKKQHWDPFIDINVIHFLPLSLSLSLPVEGFEPSVFEVFEYLFLAQPESWIAKIFKAWKVSVSKGTEMLMGIKIICRYFNAPLGRWGGGGIWVKTSLHICN